MLVIEYGVVKGVNGMDGGMAWRYGMWYGMVVWYGGMVTISKCLTGRRGDGRDHTEGV